MNDSSYQPFKYVQTAPDVERWYIHKYIIYMMYAVNSKELKRQRP